MYELSEQKLDRQAKKTNNLHRSIDGAGAIVLLLRSTPQTTHHAKPELAMFYLLLNESTPNAGALPIFDRSAPQAAALVGLTSTSLLELAIEIDRGLIASGISRTRSTFNSPFSSLAPLTLT